MLLAKVFQVKSYTDFSNDDFSSLAASVLNLWDEVHPGLCRTHRTHHLHVLL